MLFRPRWYWFWVPFNLQVARLLRLFRAPSLHKHPVSMAGVRPDPKGAQAVSGGRSRLREAQRGSGGRCRGYGASMAGRRGGVVQVLLRLVVLPLGFPLQPVPDAPEYRLSEIDIRRE